MRVRTAADYERLKHRRWASGWHSKCFNRVCANGRTFRENRIDANVLYQCLARGRREGEELWEAMQKSEESTNA